MGREAGHHTDLSFGWDGKGQILTCQKGNRDRDLSRVHVAPTTKAFFLGLGRNACFSSSSSLLQAEGLTESA
jgi:hypothetical protein